MNSKRKNLIYQTLVNHVAKNGIYDLSTKELSQEAHVAEGLIFYYFKTKQGLIDECASMYDRELMNRCTLLANEGKDIYEVWDILFDELLSSPNGAIFYFDYVNYYGFNPTENNKRAAEYLSAAKIILKDKKQLDDHKLLILWDYISTQLFYYINKIAKHELADTPQERAFIKQIAFSGYRGIC
jgi:AcrR family transcriptional regulator